MINSIGAAFITPVFFALVLGFINRGDDFSFIQLFGLYFLYSLPLFLVGGLVTSTLVQVWDTSYFAKLLVFSLSGLLFNFFLYVAIFNNYGINNIFYYAMLGVLGGLLYYHVLLTLNSFAKV
ncbi:hypothetical protein [Alteribacter natronophilus]|uniref:hypothetical protein n=1 Tax=Alteribacter natronophilus TaxID=2583810 RepID=UPI00110E7020|nr:hypothetical protein [Alteribacter natronophilus]TMW72776.1 hypothetical protein FGB90_00235 [Alteribacter natronophilus]